LADPSGFSNLLSILTGADAFSLMFPFILAWLLYYAAIEKSKVFEDTSLDNAPPLMAMILAFFTARFLVTTTYYQTFFTDFFGKIVIGLASILGFFTLLTFSGIDVGKDNTASTVIKATAGLMAAAAFIWAGGFGVITGEGQLTGMAANVVNGLLGSGLIWLLVIGVAMGAIMFTGDKGTSGED
jgi:hypothetical protein